MHNDIFKTFKTSHLTPHERGTIPPPKVVADPRPSRVGQLLSHKWDRANPFPRQEGSCFFCGCCLESAGNPNYAATVIGYCDKLCRKSHETQLLTEGTLVINDPSDKVQTHKSGESNTNWAQGWWENIASDPVYIENESHLRKVCKERKVIPKALLKHKSQGRGWEMCT